MRRGKDGVSMGKAQGFLYRIGLIKESRKSLEHVMQR
jgi:hypothetical protein